MPVYSVISKTDQAEVWRYASAEVVPGDYPLEQYDHVEWVAETPPPTPERPEDWYINVGPFYDRFGAYKLGILASTDPLVQAVIKDSSVRQYIDLKGRRAELLQAIGLLQSKGFAVDAQAILDVKPSLAEVYRRG